MSQPNQPNRYDAAVKDWFQSKTFRVLMTIALVIGALVVLCVCGTVIFTGGMLGALGRLLNATP